MIRVGAATEIEMKEKKARVEDALHATRAAVEEGIVPGGGVALLRSLSALEGLQVEPNEKFGVSLIRRAAEEPLRQIAFNAGLEGSVVVNKINESEGNFGFNAATESYEDMVAAGVIDPTKVTRTALQNAASVASLLLTTEAMIADKPEDKKDLGAAVPLPAWAAWAAWWHGRHGRHGLLVTAHNLVLHIKRSPLAGVFFCLSTWIE